VFSRSSSTRSSRAGLENDEESTGMPQTSHRTFVTVTASIAVGRTVVSYPHAAAEGTRSPRGD